MARAAITSSADTFTLSLALVTPVSELDAWLARSAPLEMTIYAIGAELPRSEASVRLVNRWISRGEVITFERPDPLYANRKQFIVQRCDTSRARKNRVRAKAEQLIILHRELVRAAAADAPCPSRSKLAETVTGRNDDAGREQVRWLMKRLEAEGKIAVQPAPVGAQHGPTITILTGRHAGKSTRRMA